MKEKYCLLNELYFEKIKEEHIQILSSFETTQIELKSFLVEDALQSQHLWISTTYLVFDAEDHQKNTQFLLGYVTLLNDSIPLDAKLKSSFRNKGINYNSLPAIKIGRICVDKKYQRKGIGKIIIAFCIRKATLLSEQIACRFITVDAKRDTNEEKDSLQFYMKQGFSILNQKLISNATTPLYLDIYPIISELKK